MESFLSDRRHSGALRGDLGNSLRDIGRACSKSTAA
jgi:hypothetical protein